MTKRPKPNRRIPLSRRVREKRNPLIGKCYQACASVMRDVPELGGDGWVMVHGRPRLTVAPFEKYGHAWLERGHGTLDAVVFDVVSGIKVPAADYYSAGEIDPTDNMFTYTSEEMRVMIDKSNHWGPWEGTEAPPLVLGDDKNT